MSAALPDKARAAIAEFGMLDAGDRVVVAVSGGADSLALLHVLHDFAPEFGLRLVVGHLHHGMRGAEADADAAFVEDVAACLGLCCCVEHVDVPSLARERKIGVEQAGREARYTFLGGLADHEGGARIALGHTGSDVVETILMNLLRGCGMNGLLGIPPVRGAVIRPLIRCSRRETETFCRNRGLVPRLDRTNLDERFLRARVRRRLLPLLEAELGEGIEAKVLQTVELLRGDDITLQSVAMDALARVCVRRGPEGVELDLSRLADLPPALMDRVVREALRDLQGGILGIERTHVEAIRALATAGQTGGEVHLPGGLVGRRGYVTLELRPGRASEWDSPGWESLVLVLPGSVPLPGLGLAIRGRLCAPGEAQFTPGGCDAWLDADYVGRDLVVRSWQAGDRFQPLGMKGTKKVHDLFVDEKVPRWKRALVPIVTRPDGEIVWVAGHRIDHRARITTQTQAAAHLVLGPADRDAMPNGGAEERL